MERPLLPAWNLIGEFLRIGVPLGLSIFVETSIFGAIAFLVAKFGTDAIAGSQAAMSFTSLVYMIPLSVSMSMTILVGIEAGARRWSGAEQYGNVGLAFNWTCALVIPSLIFLFRQEIAMLYLEEPAARALCATFTAYGSLFVMGDAVAAPIQGILRGYKQVRLPFYSAVVAYWGICAPLGLYFDYGLGHGAFPTGKAWTSASPCRPCSCSGAFVSCAVACAVDVLAVEAFQKIEIFLFTPLQV